MATDTNKVRNRRVKADIKPQTHELITNIVDRGVALGRIGKAVRPRIVYRIELIHKRTPLRLEDWFAANDADFIEGISSVLLGSDHPSIAYKAI